MVVKVLAVRWVKISGHGVCQTSERGCIIISVNTFFKEENRKAKSIMRE